MGPKGPVKLTYKLNDCQYMFLENEGGLENVGQKPVGPHVARNHRHAAACGRAENVKDVEEIAQPSGHLCGLQHVDYSKRCYPLNELVWLQE